MRCACLDPKAAVAFQRKVAVSQSVALKEHDTVAVCEVLRAALD